MLWEIYFVSVILISSHAYFSRGNVVVLDWEDRPQEVITFSGLRRGNAQYTIVAKDPTKYKVSISLERMNARTCDSNMDHPVVVVHQGREFDFICLPDVNYQPFYDEVSAVYAFDRAVTVYSAGSWGPYEEAQLAATIFLEVPDCSNCPSGTFCCQERGTCSNGDVSGQKRNILSLNRTDSPPFGVESELPRCIPNALKCNGHPNCGRVCNADESRVTCSGDSLHVGIPSRRIAVIGVFSIFVYSRFCNYF